MESKKEVRYWLWSGGVKLGLLLLIALVSLSLMGFEFLGFAYHSWHQKMTVEVEVNGKLYAGSSVVAMSVFRHPEIPMVRGVRNLKLQGEAVVVKLPESRFLFALLSYNAFLARDVFKDRIAEAVREPGEQWAGAIAELRETREIKPKDYPLLVTFADINDPKTVQKVESDDLGASFGPGVTLKHITLEITDESVTEGKIEQVLPCLRSGKACVPLNRKLPYGHPMSNILNKAFWRPK